MRPVSQVRDLPVVHGGSKGRRALALGAALLALAATTALPARAAEPWPQARPIRIIVPLPPGGPSDIVLRPLAASLQKTLGQAVIIDNRPGANGNIGSAEAARAEPDGYTWLWTTDTSLTINPHIYKNIGFKPERLVPLDYVARFSQTLVCHPSTGFKTLADLVKAAKDKPLTYASGGAGSPGHMVMEMLLATAGVQMTHVPYRGPAPAMQDLLGGQVPCGFLAGPTVLPQVRSGRLVALAVSGPQRSSLMPDVPTVSETPGYSAFDGTFWLVLMAPKGVPADVQQRFLAALDAAGSAPGQARLATDAGIEMTRSTPAEARTRTDALFEKWGKLATRINLRVE